MTKRGGFRGNLLMPKSQCTVVQNCQESRRKYWVIHLSVCLFTHSLALPCSLCSRTPLHSFVMNHSALIPIRRQHIATPQPSRHRPNATPRILSCVRHYRHVTSRHCCIAALLHCCIAALLHCCITSLPSRLPYT